MNLNWKLVLLFVMPLMGTSHCVKNCESQEYLAIEFLNASDSSVIPFDSLYSTVTLIERNDTIEDLGLYQADFILLPFDMENTAATYVFEGTGKTDTLKMSCDSIYDYNRSCKALLLEISNPWPEKITWTIFSYNSTSIWIDEGSFKATPYFKVYL